MISPDSSRVVYLADQERDTVIEVYSVPLLGPAEAGVKLNRGLVDGGSVKFFPPDAVQISTDSSRVVYLADQERDTVIELYSVPLSGPAGLGVKLNGLLMGGGNVMAFRISPECSRVVYRADQDSNNVYELYSTPLVGPANEGIKLSKLLTVDGDVIDFDVSPDSRWVVYRAYQDHNELFELHRVPLMGPTTLGVKIGPLLVGGVVKPAPFDAVKITPDSSRVVYIAYQPINGQDELYSVPISGPAGLGVKLNGGLAAGGDVTPFLISPDSRRVVYRANQQAINVFELYSTPTEGPASAGIKLNGPLTANGSVKDFFGISPDSGRVLYIADQDTDEMSELYLTSNYWLHLPLINKMN
jgi:Tol biopolymer transport system component